MRVNIIIVGFILLFITQVHAVEGQSPVAFWNLDSIERGTVADQVGSNDAEVMGTLEVVSGAVSDALLFNGTSDCLTVNDTDALSFTNATFSLSAWVNVHALGRGQQMIIAKNNYSRGWREWGVMLDSDNRFAVYLFQAGWHSLHSTTTPVVGEWYHLAITCNEGFVCVYINGVLENKQKLVKSLPATDADLTMGASVNGSRLMQQFFGALDEVQVFNDVLSSSAIFEMANISSFVSHSLQRGKLSVQEPASVLLWTIPGTAGIPLVSNVVFHAIKAYEPDMDGYHWLHGVNLAWYKGKLYASFGHNSNGENSKGETANYRVSGDGGVTWGLLKTIAAPENNRSVSHGVFCPTANGLWAFHGTFYNRMQKTHCRAYRLNEETGSWEPQGTVAGNGFWPMQQPVRMDSGNWIMAGLRICNGYSKDELEGGFSNLPAVAISHGDDFTQWDMTVMQLSDGVEKPWGESGVIVEGSYITLVSRWNQDHPYALVAESLDCGASWTSLKPANLPMAPSKPCVGMLSTGQCYLIANSSADGGNVRSPLTIAYSLLGETGLTQLRVIRHAVESNTPWNGNGLSYPCAVEKDGCLYVGYSNNAYRERNRNNAELAVVPISSLK